MKDIKKIWNIKNNIILPMDAGSGACLHPLKGQIGFAIFDNENAHYTFRGFPSNQHPIDNYNKTCDLSYLYNFFGKIDREILSSIRKIFLEEKLVAKRIKCIPINSNCSYIEYKQYINKLSFKSSSIHSRNYEIGSIQNRPQSYFGSFPDEEKKEPNDSCTESSFKISATNLPAELAVRKYIFNKRQSCFKDKIKYIWRVYENRIYVNNNAAKNDQSRIPKNCIKFETLLQMLNICWDKPKELTASIKANRSYIKLDELKSNAIEITNYWQLKNDNKYSFSEEWRTDKQYRYFMLEWLVSFDLKQEEKSLFYILNNSIKNCYNYDISEATKRNNRELTKAFNEYNRLIKEAELNIQIYKKLLLLREFRWLTKILDFDKIKEAIHATDPLKVGTYYLSGTNLRNIPKYTLSEKIYNFRNYI